MRAVCFVTSGSANTGEREEGGYLVRGAVEAEDVHLTIGARGSLVALHALMRKRPEGRVR
jgi:hypothetical protein